MKYIKPPEFKSVKEFEKYYKNVENEITELLTSDSSVRTANELNEKLNKVLTAAVSFLSKKNSEYSKKELPKAFEETDKNSSSEAPKKSKEEVSKILASQGFKYAKNAFSNDTYIELQTALKNAENDLKKRVNKIIKDLRKTGKDSVYNVQQEIIKNFEENNILTVKYSNGAKQPLSSYAAMVARSARIETINISAIGGALQANTDLVKMTRMPQCCKLCAAYQDKVYSISGKDKRFPALFKTVLKNGYALPHPNCRHEFIAWFEELESPEEVEKAIQKSKIKYDKSGNLVDVRYQKDIKGYQEWQAGNRQLNKEFSEYEKMRTYYESKDMQPPYTTLAGFRRARRKKAEEYKENKKVWNKIADFSKYGEKLPKPKGYPREFLKSAKYEKKFTEIVSLDIAHKLTVFAREVIRENDRLNEETAIAITLSGEKILKQHSPKLTIYIDETEINKQTDDSVILIHNHPQNDTFSSYDLGFMQNKKIHTLIAVCHDGKVFSLRTNCGKTVDNYIISEYNRNTIDKKASEKVFLFMAKKYGWEYKEL